MTHQHKYADSLVANDLSRVKCAEEDLVPEELHAKFSSLLGVVAWTVLTRADLAVYVQALQRRGAGPRLVDLRRLNLVLRYLKRHKVGIWSCKVPEPWRLTGFSDSAFRVQENESSGLALRGLAVLLTTACEENPSSPMGEINPVYFLIRRSEGRFRSRTQCT